MNIFLVDSTDYSKELMNYYLEEELGLSVTNFHQPDEMLSYLKIVPDIIVYDRKQFNISSTIIDCTRKGCCDPIVLSLTEEEIIVEKVNDLNELEILKVLPLQNTYFSTVKACEEILVEYKSKIV